MPFFILAALLALAFAGAKVGASLGKRMTERGKNLLRQWEGVRLKTYTDAAGLPTIGIGHLLTTRELLTNSVTINGKIVSIQDGLTLAQAEALLEQDLAQFESAVSDSVKQPLTPNQRDALISLSFNIGTGAFISSTLVRKLNQGDYQAVPDEFRRWNKVKGIVNQGLVNRREQEIALWNA